MKLRQSALALAIAGIMAAPMAVQADSGFYGSVRIGVENVDSGGVTEMSVKNWASRMGFKGEADLGNGMTGYGKYEFSVNNSDGAAGASLGTRHQMVGLKGAFGNVFLGQTYHTFYNTVVGPLDNPWWGSGDAMVSYTGRTNGAISYAGDFGAVSVGATLYMRNTARGGVVDTAGEGETMDGTEIGVSFDAGPVRVGVAVQDMQGNGAVDPESVMGITASGISFGGVTAGIGYQTQDVQNTSLTNTSIVLDVGFGPGYLHYEMMDNDETAGAANNPDPTSLTLGYTHSIGRQTTAWFEYQMVDSDDGLPSATSADADTIRAALKFDWK